MSDERRSNAHIDHLVEDVWSTLPSPLKVVVAIGLFVYFAGGVIAPLFWAF